MKHASKDATFAADYVDALVAIARWGIAPVAAAGPDSWRRDCMTHHGDRILH